MPELTMPELIIGALYYDFKKDLSFRLNSCTLNTCNITILAWAGYGSDKTTPFSINMRITDMSYFTLDEESARQIKFSKELEALLE